MKKSNRKAELRAKIKEISDGVAGELVDLVIERLKDDDGVSVGADSQGIDVYFYGEQITSLPWHTPTFGHILRDGLENEISCGCIEESPDDFKAFAKELRSLSALIEESLPEKSSLQLV